MERVGSPSSLVSPSGASHGRWCPCLIWAQAFLHIGKVFFYYVFITFLVFICAICFTLRWTVDYVWECVCVCLYNLPIFCYFYLMFLFLFIVLLYWKLTLVDLLQKSTNFSYRPWRKEAIPCVVAATALWSLQHESHYTQCANKARIAPFQSTFTHSWEQGADQSSRKIFFF